ncbi:MAG: threonine synthase [Synergistaceae bacterium]|jgi:threonine synthase|nr:threonine synthase [Synergistaceae bacterium]
MPKPSKLRCVLCGKVFDPDCALCTCDVCGIDGTLDVLCDFPSIKPHFTPASLRQNRDMSLWRYAPLLPVLEETSIPRLHSGWTPLYRSEKLAREFGVREVFIKDDGRNPTGSLKDRASAVGVAKALDFRRSVVACASTGNAAGSLAGFAAVTGLKAVIFVPERAPAAKVTQLLIYGATVVLVQGDYADAFRLATEAIDRFGWYNRNCAINPYLVEGKKTCALEIAEQLQWDVPDRVFISMGDGCCAGGLYKGFSDLKELNFIDRLPKITGVQAEGARPLYDAFRAGLPRVTFGKAETLADSIAVGAPRNWAKALRAVRNTEGEILSVTDGEILEALAELPRQTGVFGEPAGAAAFAGLKKAARTGLLGPSDRIVIVVTGNGLKDIGSAQKATGKAVTVLPDLADFQRKVRIQDL